MKRLLLLSLILTGCATQPIRKVDLMEGVDLSRNAQLVCAFIKNQQRLLCMTPRQWEMFQEPADPPGLDTGPSPEVIPLFEKVEGTNAI